MLMRRATFGLAALSVVAGPAFAAENITGDTLTNEEVQLAIQPMLYEFYYLLGIFQEGKRATIYYYTLRAGFPPLAARLSQIDCFHFNDGRWYCINPNGANPPYPGTFVLAKP
jgi:hypothetical protein